VRHENHDGRRHAGDADEVADQVPLAAEEIRQRGPEQRRDDARGGDARRVVV